MVTICILIIIGTILYSYYQKKRKTQSPSDSASQSASEPPSEPPSEPAPLPVPKPAPKPAPKPTPQPKQNPDVIWEDHSCRLSFEPDGLQLRYHGSVYRFSGDSHEPMAIILKAGEAVAYIHNSFEIDFECGQFRRNPNYKCGTITGRNHDAKHFCLLLTTAIDYGYNWQIDDLERKVDELTRYDSREVWYRENGIEFGRYGDEPGGREQYHYEYEILYIIVDGHKYILNDNVNEPNALYLFYPGGYCRRQAVLRIHGTNGAVLAAYADDWKSGRTFTPFGRPCDTKTFCAMLAYALRSGKKDFNLRELEKLMEEPVSEYIYFSYGRESVCAADDYINKSHKFEFLDSATLEELISYLTNYHEDGGYAAIPYTGGDARWCISSDNRVLAEVSDSGSIISFYSYAPDTRLRDIFSTSDSASDSTSDSTPGSTSPLSSVTSRISLRATRS